MEAVTDEQRILLERIFRVLDVQSAHQHGRTTSSVQCPQTPRQKSRPCMMKVCGGASVCKWIQHSQRTVRETATVLLSLGGLVRSESRTRTPAFWASWAVCLGMIHQRHPDVAAQLVRQLEGHPHTPSLEAAANAARSLRGVQKFELPSWEALTHGVRPAPRQPDEFEPGCERSGWAARGGLEG